MVLYSFSLILMFIMQLLNIELLGYCLIVVFFYLRVEKEKAYETGWQRGILNFFLLIQVFINNYKGRVIDFQKRICIYSLHNFIIICLLFVVVLLQKSPI